MLFYNKNKNKLKSLKNVHIKTKQEENGNETNKKNGKQKQT